MSATGDNPDNALRGRFLAVASGTRTVMSNERREDVRAKAMTVFLLDRVREGYAIETHTKTHAIIGPSSRWVSLNPFRKASGRHVVAVDDNGDVTMRPAEPRRT